MNRLDIDGARRLARLSGRRQRILGHVRVGAAFVIGFIFANLIV